ncbi:cyclic pyranopterin monophosphate synthase MoaC [Salinicola rhizosphaerae]|uniref:Cyclic pyranopterin monophosphate synthase n=1 Tax=Salinicola rhizosphaerae TaxID=1443141 RepID=A0ABQ3DTA9_9GAMM|nr:cyclic pyranopterin monophosphate synthase MoaC [Salinicola rhizosphaerae]GHB10583.1 hypothetical protein GCM10009038_05480 [Salinicola rhizosphaerae]
MTLTHLNARGEAHMVDVADKAESRREARARGTVRMLPATLALLVEGGLPKGDVLATARIAGIQAAKRTHELIPLCHALALSKVTVEFEIDVDDSCVHVESSCRLNGRTGVEMEALTAVSVACLTLYDMCKAVDKGMTIDDVRLEAKSGGRSGDWRREVDARPAGMIASHAPAEGELNDGAEPAGRQTIANADGSPVGEDMSRAIDEPRGKAGGDCEGVITVRFLAELRERLGCETLTLPLGDLGTRDVAGVKRALAAADARFEVLDGKRVLVAHNQVMAGEGTAVNAADEIAFFPPVTGG